MRDTGRQGVKESAEQQPVPWGRQSEERYMKKVKETEKKEKPKRPIRDKAAGSKIDKIKISGIPGYTPGELPKR